MILADVMYQLANALEGIPGLQVDPHPVGKVVVPQAIVSYPTDIVFDETYSRGMDRMELNVILVVGKTIDIATRTAISAYCDGSGDQSIKAALEDGTYTAFDAVRVVRVDFDSVTYAGVEYLAALFTLDIAGQGA